MTGSFPPDASLSTVLELVSSAHERRKVLIVIDQFEDAIPHLGQPPTYELLTALRNSHLSSPRNMRLLICYRGDADPRVGRYWQIVSGSPTGLPRYYLEPLDLAAAETIVWEILVPHLRSATPDDARLFVDDVVADLRNESASTYPSGVYPPFLQMVGESLLRASDDRGVTLSTDFYRSLGGSRELIGRYLVNQLRFLHEHQKEARLILQALASRTRRLRKPVDQLAAETNTNSAVAESCLEQLSSLRLVRETGGSWEIVHDFVARRVIEDLTDPEEQEARVFRDLLIAKAGAFDRTGELLTTTEHLSLYACRRRITCAPEEVKLLFLGRLAGHGPVAYYLRQVTQDDAIAWAGAQCSSDHERMRINAHRFLLSLGRAFPLGTVATVFGDHKLQFELAPLVETMATASDADLALLLRLRNKKAEMVAHAATGTIARLLTGSTGHDRILETLSRSGKHSDLRLLCRVLSDRARPDHITRYRSDLVARRFLARAQALCALGSLGSRGDAALLEDRLRRVERRELQVCAWALATWCHKNRCSTRMRTLLRARKPDAVLGALAAVDGDRAGVALAYLLGSFARFPEEVGAAVLRTVKLQDRTELRGFLRSTPLTRHTRDLLMALIRVGSARDARFVLHLIASSEEQVYFWNVPRLADALASRADRSLLKWFRSLVESEEFWRYMRGERAERPLPVVNHENLYLFKRLAGSCLASVCGAGEWPLLRRLVFHDYWNIQVAAGRSIAQFAGESELDELVAEARADPSRLNSGSGDSGVMLAICTLDEKVHALCGTSPG
jgi:hypothetical protein